MMKKTLTALIFCSFTIFGTSSAVAIEPPAQMTASFPIERVDLSQDERIVDFFWYGCRHCRTFQPYLERLKKDVASTCGKHIESIPAVLQTKGMFGSEKRGWDAEAALYFALRETTSTDPDVFERLHRTLFEDVQSKAVKAADPSSVAAWAKRNGIDGSKLASVLRSNTVLRQVDAAAEKVSEVAAATRFRGVPSLLIGNRAIAYPSHASDPAKASSELLGLICPTPETSVNDDA